MKICGFDDLLLGFKDDVIKSQNQILISYFILDGVIGREDYQNFVVSASESEWLQNYHYLLKYDRSNIEILIPSHANNQRRKDSYHDFYNLNIENNIPIVKPISEVTSSIESYVQSKIDSYREEGQKRGIII